MEHVLVGRTDLRVSRVGFGGAAIGGYDYGSVDDSESERAIRRALDLGVTFIDTADVYGFGHAESIVGCGIAERRGDVCVATKVGVRWNASGETWRDLSPQYVRQALDASLRRLRVERIDIYQLHWPDVSTPLENTIGVLLEAQEAGKIAHIGICNFTLAQIDLAQTVGRVETCQLSYNMIERDMKPLALGCSRNHGMSVIAYNALAQGLLTGKFTQNATFLGTDLRRRSPRFSGRALEEYLELVDRIRRVANRLGCTSAQLAVRWVLDQQGIAIALTGIKTARQAEENVSSLSCQLSVDDLAAIDEVTSVATGLPQGAADDQ